MTALLTTKQAADMIGCSRSNILSMVKRGTLAHVRLGPRKLRIREDVLRSKYPDLEKKNYGPPNPHWLHPETMTNTDHIEDQPDHGNQTWYSPTQYPRLEEHDVDDNSWVSVLVLTFNRAAYDPSYTWYAIGRMRLRVVPIDGSRGSYRPATSWKSSCLEGYDLFPEAWSYLPAPPPQ